MCRVYERERKKIKAKAIDSNTTALDEGKAEEEVTTLYVALAPRTVCMSLATLMAFIPPQCVHVTPHLR